MKGAAICNTKIIFIFHTVISFFGKLPFKAFIERNQPKQRSQRKINKDYFTLITILSLHKTWSKKIQKLYILGQPQPENFNRLHPKAHPFPGFPTTAGRQPPPAASFLSPTAAGSRPGSPSAVKSPTFSYQPHPVRSKHFPDKLPIHGYLLIVFLVCGVLSKQRWMAIAGPSPSYTKHKKTQKKLSFFLFIYLSRSDTTVCYYSIGVYGYGLLQMSVFHLITLNCTNL